MIVQSELQSRKLVFERPRIFHEVAHHLCMGCGYGPLARILVEEIDRLPTEQKIVGVSDIGCTGFFMGMLGIDVVGSCHGRAISVGTALKAARPDLFVLVVLGDGAVLSEGLNETIHAAARGQSITVIMGNNGVLADTGGQLTGSTILGHVTPTTPRGRDARQHGHPIPIAEMLAQVPGTAYVARIATHDPALVYRGQKSIRRAFQSQLADAGFSFLDVVSTCPTTWSMTPIEAVEYQATEVLKTYPVGVIKDWAPAR